MSNLMATKRSKAGGCLLFLIALSSVSPLLAQELREPLFDAAAAHEFPQSVFDEITDKISSQTTFEQFTPNGLLRWWTRSIKLVDFVRSPSRDEIDTDLYAMRYAVSVLSEEDSLAVYHTSCQVVVVRKAAKYDEPTVVCEPVNIDQRREAL